MRENFEGEWKSKPGPWNGEPDEERFSDEASGFPIYLKRGPGGHWCGYVGVGAGHPWFKKDYDEVYNISDVRVHGGLTFAGPWADNSAAEWWLGFDCAHSGDYSPKYDRIMVRGVYRNVEYARNEALSLATQARSALTVEKK